MNQILANLVGAGSVTGADDTGPVQTLQITERASGSGFADRVLDKVLRFFQFGFTSVPPLDSETLTLRRGGERGLTIVIGTNHRPSRPTGLQPGDSAQYDARGAIIKLTAAGLTIDCAGLPYVIQNTSGVNIKGDLVVDGEITGLNTSSALTMSAIRSFANSHDHSGVSTGTGNSGHATTTL